MLTWQRLRDLRLAELQGAADGWAEASNRADAGRDRLSNEMANRLASTQKGEAAKAALTRLTRLDRNFEYLYTECGLVRTALNSLAYELSGPQRQVQDALEDAASLRLTVHGDGSVGYPAGGENIIDGKPLPGGRALPTSPLTLPTTPLGAGGGPPGLASQNPHHAKAQDVADRIAKAVREATEIDLRFSETLAKLKAAPGLTVDTRTWTDAAADAAAVRGMADDYLRNDIPLDKSPAERRAWWSYLTQEQREAYLAVYPDVIGNLDGIPAEVRDTANRDNLQLLIGKLEGQEGERARTQLAGLYSIDRQLRAEPEPGVPPMYLLGIGDQGTGRAIVSFGNPDTAKNVSAYVPGLGTALDEHFAENDIKRARQTAAGATFYDQSSASIVWLGYDPPQLPAEQFAENLAVTRDTHARVGAVAYNAFMEGLSATNEHQDPHLTAIGHSYGSLTVGLAAQREGGIPGADDIILLGSPGTEARTADDLGVGRDHVFVGAAENDPVTKLPDQMSVHGLKEGFELGYRNQTNPVAGVFAGAVTGAAGFAAGNAVAPESKIYYGTDPAHEEFGARRFKVDDGPPAFRSADDPTPAHSNYFDPTTDDESARNIAKIVAGRSDQITTQEYR
ncbi:alpha/beta hydrolase [Streptomyces sp. NPDC126499]|uniref:alpha/beta hydrolase n=1 Tax=Streptomyces sp. NPDC126499 TaxID=3155314 RepID=UPI0033277860